MKKTTSAQALTRLKHVSIAALTVTSLLGSYTIHSPLVQPASATSYITQESWSANLFMARLTTANQLVLQLDVGDKPVTSYANAVYQIYARKNSEWVQIYNSTGARLIANGNGRITLAPETIDCGELQKQLGTTDLSQVELKAVALLRYDVRGGRRDQLVRYEQIQRYSAIAMSSTVQIASNQTFDYRSRDDRKEDRDDDRYDRKDRYDRDDDRDDDDRYDRKDRKERDDDDRYDRKDRKDRDDDRDDRKKDRRYNTDQVRLERGGFNLSIVQKERTLSNVIARISFKSKERTGFSGEQFLGDFKYKLKDKYKAKFVKGLKAGDRVVVRLFNTRDEFIGYSEFEMLSEHTAVTLVLPDRTTDFGLVRTIYGVDVNQDFSIDRSVQVYDFFTQVSRTQRWQEAQVTFFSVARNINLSAFDLIGLPAPQRNCSYPASFQTGSFMLVNQVLSVFSSNLSSVFTAVPGKVVQTVSISETTTYQVSQLMTTYQSVNTSQGTVLVVDRDDDKYGKKKKHCNQGIGNGSEGCDPGNSRPHGGSNDEGGRRSGKRK
ncbi:hypothetical protein ACN4EG_11105 [Alkalinema pantanalense CENA528]|uniref:hypothetical protein n=1 Tax=Alkalinema pantanalense TaxID=1620705 RepID=UPI003D6E241D